MRVLFMGTPEFAVPCLEAILKNGDEVCGVFTQPDRPKGRGMQLCPPPVKAAALAHGLAVFQPRTLKGEDAAAKIRSLAPELIVVVAYGRILPGEVLNIPPLGCVNVHASLLPRYRGAAPIQWCLIKGETQTGITTMFMNEGLDTGDMILKSPLAVGPDETYGELHDRLMRQGSETLLETMRLIKGGHAPREPQTDEGTCYAPMIEKQTTRINFRKGAGEIHNLVRGLAPAPCAHTVFRGKVLKIYRSEICGARGQATPGTVLAVDESGICVCCGSTGGDCIRFTVVQEQGGKKMAAGDYVRGHRVTPGDRFSDGD